MNFNIQHVNQINIYNHNPQQNTNFQTTSTPAETTVEDILPAQPTYSSYLKRDQGLGKTNEEIQQHLHDAARAGAAQLARYLTSNEGKIYFDFRGEKKSQIIATLNQELGTRITEKAFCAALSRSGLVL